MRGKKPSTQQIVLDPSQTAFTVLQASVYTGLSPWRVRMNVWEGRLKAHKDGKALVILKADLDAFLPNLPVVEPNAAPWLARRSAKAAV